MKIRIDKCQWCGGEEFYEGYQSYLDARIKSKHSPFKNSTINYVICSQCGSIVRSYVDDPKKFIPRP